MDEVNQLIPNMDVSSQKVGTIDLVIAKILDFFPIEDLLPIRFVNKQWNHIATHLTQKNGWPLNFYYYHYSSDYQLGNGATLQNLNEFLSHSQNLKFPCQNFKFSRSSFQNESVKNFFKIQGHLIHTLDLDLDCQLEEYPKFLETLAKILNKAPNLKRLSLKQILNKKVVTSQVDDVSLFQIPVQLKSLRRLDLPFDIPRQLLVDILRAAVNLKMVTNFYIYLTPDFILANKIRTIKKLNFIQKNDVDYLTQFSNWAPQLQEINLDLQCIAPHPQYFDEVTRAMSKILRSSADTLRVVKSLEDLCLLPEFLSKIVFPNVKKLIFGYALPNCVMVPPGCHIFQQFPSLEEIHVLSCHKWDDLLWTNLGGQTPRASVKKLQLSFDCTPNNIFNLFSRALPNLNSLVVTVDKEAGKVLENIFKFFKEGKIQNLEIFVSKSFSIDDSFWKIESKMAGVLIEDCPVVRESRDSIFSIWDLKGLASFTLNFDYCVEWEDDEQKDPWETDQDLEDLLKDKIFFEVTGLELCQLKKEQNLVICVNADQGKSKNLRK